MENLIIETAQRIHNKLWYKSGNVSKGTKLANQITREWQNELTSKFENDLMAEFKIADHRNEKIDLVDPKNKVAYELRVSPKNIHHEFYKDIFKVLVAKNCSGKAINKFIFIAPEEAIRKIEKQMSSDVIEIVSSLNLEIVLIAIT